MEEQNNETNRHESNSNTETSELQMTSLRSRDDNPIRHILGILQAALPYVDIRSMHTVSILVKATELVDSLNNPSEDELAACELNEGRGDMEAMMNNIKGLCTEKEKEFVDIILNFMTAKKYYNTYQAMSSAGKDKKSDGSNPLASMFGFDENINIMDIVSTMLTPEQKSTFDTINMFKDMAPNITI